MNREPRPVVSALIFVLGALLLGAGLQWTSDTFAPVYRSPKLRMQLLEQVAPEIEVINAGNSLNRAIDYHHMDLRGFHLWDGGADLLDASYALRVITPMLPKLKVVLVPLNPLSFRTDKTGIGRDGLRRHYYAVMPTLASWRPLPGDVGNLMRGKLSSIVREDHWRDVIRTAFVGNQRARRRPLQEVDETGYFLPYPPRTVAPDSQRIEELEGFFFELEQSVRANPTLPENVYREFAAVIARVRARGTRVVLYSPPYMESVNQLFASQTTEMAELGEYVRRLGNDYGVEYLDFSTDAAFSNNPDLFMSEDHLNKFGAAVFSRKLSGLLALTGDQVRRRPEWNPNQLIGQRDLEARVGVQPDASTGRTRGADGRSGDRAGNTAANAGDLPPSQLSMEGWAVETREGNVATLVSQRMENWMRVTIAKLASRSMSSIRLRKGPVPVTRAHRYELKFWMKADAARPVTCGLASGTSAETRLGESTRVDAGTWWQEFSCSFKATATDTSALIFFDLGTSEAALELSKVELRDLTTGTLVMSTDPAWKPPAPKMR